MSVEEILGRARQGGTCPRELDALDTGLFLGARAIYREFGMGTLTKEEADRDLTALMNLYKQEAGMRALNRRLSEHQAARTKALQMALMDYGRQRSVKAADHLVAVLDGVLQGEILKDREGSART